MPWDYYQKIRRIKDYKTVESEYFAFWNSFLENFIFVPLFEGNPAPTQNFRTERKIHLQDFVAEVLAHTTRQSIRNIRLVKNLER